MPAPAPLGSVGRWCRRFGRAARSATTRLRTGDHLTHASSIAYYALVSLFPFLLITVWGIGRLTADPGRRAAVTDFVLRFFPAQVGLVRAHVEAVAEAGVGFSVAGAAVAFWVSLGIFWAVSIAVNRAWNIDPAPTFIRHQLRAFVMFIGAAGMIASALAWVSLVGMLRAGWFAAGLDAMPMLSTVADFPSRYTAMGAVMLVSGLIFTFVPPTPVRGRDVWVGAAVTGLLWQGGLAGFSWYLREVADLSIHGSIATVVTFLFWVYTSAVIFLFGTEFTAAWIRELETDVYS